jgi:hypothetical protein
MKHAIKGEIERRIEVTGRRGRRCKQLPNNFKETTRYWKLKEEALGRTLWKPCFVRSNGPVIRQKTQ